MIGEFGTSRYALPIVWGHDMKMDTIFRFWEAAQSSLSGVGELWCSSGWLWVYQSQSEYIESDATASETNSAEPQQLLEFVWRLHVGCWP